jgi:hypothetical protein
MIFPQRLTGGCIFIGIKCSIVRKCHRARYVEGRVSRFMSATVNFGRDNKGQEAACTINAGDKLPLGGAKEVVSCVQVIICCVVNYNATKEVGPPKKMKKTVLQIPSDRLKTVSRPRRRILLNVTLVPPYVSLSLYLSVLPLISIHPSSQYKYYIYLASSEMMRHCAKCRTCRQS